jgi:hypothetical protein
MARARLTNRGDVIREDGSEDQSTEAETQVSREMTQTPGLQIDSEELRIGGLELPMSSVLVILVLFDILVSAGVLFDE